MPVPSSEGTIRKIIADFKRVAVVGMSSNPEKASHVVGRYLKDHGYDVIPVNPSAGEILGMKVYKSLGEIPGGVEVVDIFRPPQDVLPVVEEAIAAGAKAVWMQEGIVNHEAAELAEKNGLLVVMDRCMLKEHKKMSVSRSKT